MNGEDSPQQVRDLFPSAPCLNMNLHVIIEGRIHSSHGFSFLLALCEQKSAWANMHRVRFSLVRAFRVIASAAEFSEKAMNISLTVAKDLFLTKKTSMPN